MLQDMTRCLRQAGGLCAKYYTPQVILLLLLLMIIIMIIIIIIIIFVGQAGGLGAKYAQSAY